MSETALALLAVNLACDTTGHLAFKAATDVSSQIRGFARWRAMLADKWIWIGCAAFACELFAWLAFLSLVPLAVGVLVGCVNIVAILIGGRIFFGEALTMRRVGAVLLITCGVLLVGVGG